MAKRKMKYDFQIIDIVYEWETNNNIPSCDRVTEWFNDYDMAVPKYINGASVPMKTIKDKYKQIMKENKENEI